MIEMLRAVLTVLYWPIQLTLAVALIYFSAKCLLIMYTLSPLYRGRLPYVPTRKKSLAEAFSMLDVKDGDSVVDLGCGDGQFLLHGARKTGATFTGIELNWLLFMISRLKVFARARSGRVTVQRSDYMKVPLSQFNKVFMFNMPSCLKVLVPKLEKELQVGTRVLSVVFPFSSKKFKLLDTGGTKTYPLFLYERVN